MAQDPFFYIIAIPTVIIIALSKAGFGLGFSIIGVPMLSLVISPVQAAAILSPIVCIMDLFTIWAYPPKTWDRKNLYILIPALILGIILGVFSSKFFNESYIKLMVGIIAVSFSLKWWLQRNTPQPYKSTNISIVRGTFWGALSGFTTFLAHSGGPPLAVYLLPQRLGKTILAGTSVIFFTIGNFIKLIGYIWLGQLNNNNLLVVLLMTPAVVIGVAIGKWLHNRMTADMIYASCYALLIPIGLKLIADGLHI